MTAWDIDVLNQINRRKLDDVIAQARTLSKQEAIDYISLAGRSENADDNFELVANVLEARLKAAIIMFKKSVRMKPAEREVENGPLKGLIATAGNIGDYIRSQLATPQPKAKTKVQ
jgi:hypothetical protein